MSDVRQQSRQLEETGWQRRIREGCLERGWSNGELARQTGISRGALYNMRRGETRNPRATTLHAIAKAFGIDPRTLDEQNDDVPAADIDCSTIPDDRCGEDRRFDRLTNPLVDVVHRDTPELFHGWERSDWDELYSVFGTGGRLNEEGVTEMAKQMNRTRETVQRLQIIMETHLAEVAERLVDTLFEMTRPQSNLVDSAKLQQLLSGMQPPADTSEIGNTDVV